jgi:altronate hydrolase
VRRLGRLLGITANPALGAAVDNLVRHGGTAVLSETPEIYGAEHLLTRRARNREVGEKLVDIIHWWQAYCAKNDGSMDNNPSPGNKQGGLTTILEKSLGAAAKGGTTTLNQGLPLRRAGHRQGLRLHGHAGLRSRRGHRPGGGRLQRAVLHHRTRLAYGCKPTPSIKLATNTTSTAACSTTWTSTAATSSTASPSRPRARRSSKTILRVASGSKTKSELLGYGDNEFVPWQIGATM